MVLFWVTGAGAHHEGVEAETSQRLAKPPVGTVVTAPLTPQPEVNLSAIPRARRRRNGVGNQKEIGHSTNFEN